MSSYARTMIEYARPRMVAERARAIAWAEGSKGCLPELACEPVPLEPPYSAVLAAPETRLDRREALPMLAPVVGEAELVRHQAWISPNQGFDWKRSERFLKQLASVKHRVGFEIVGNRDGIRIQLLCHVDDLPIVQNAFRAEFDQCVLSPISLELGPDSSAPNAIAILDWYPPPPYYHLFTRPDELRTTLYSPVFQALADMIPPAVGAYQALFKPVPAEHNWHRNVQALLDLEYLAKLLGGSWSAYRYAQQAPSGDLRQMAGDLEIKAHSDKPFFAAAIRIAVWGSEDAGQLLLPLGSLKSLIQHGGRPLDQLTNQDYAREVNPDRIQDMLRLGLTYRPGFLVNSWELTSLVHVPAIVATESHRLPVASLETLLPRRSLVEGTRIGTCNRAGCEEPVSIPPKVRTCHVHIIGRPGSGKSTLMGHSIMDDIERGCGVALIDPHGSLVRDLLCMIRKEHADRVIYLNPADPLYVPLWNPLHSGALPDPGRAASDLVRTFQSIVEGWGDRLAHLLRHAFFALLHVPGASMRDVADLLRKGTPASNQIIRLILESPMTNDLARAFWTEDFPGYGKDDLRPPQHKLSKLLLGGTVAMMLSQPESRINLRQIMDEGRILLVDLSNLGADVRDTLGCFILSQVHLTALGRLATAHEQPLLFHTYCDEAHRFVTGAMEDLIAETRKFGVSLTLAHQYLKQFTESRADALANVGSTIIFNVDSKDAGHLQKDLRGKVTVEDLTTLDR